MKLNSGLKSTLKYILFLGIGGFLFYLAFRNTEFEKLLQDFRKANYWYILASMTMGFLAFISRGIRWTLLLAPLGVKPGTWNSIHSVSIGYFSNLLVPRAGELARCTALNRVDKIPVNRLFGTVILERVVDFMMLILLILLTFIMKFDELTSFFNTAFESQSQPSDSSSTLIKLLIAGGLISFFIVLYLVRARFNHLPLYHKVREFWWGIKDGLKSISKLESIWPFLFHTLFIWGMYYLMVYVCFFSMGATDHLSASDGLFIVIVAGLGMVVPTPGGIGAYHYLVMLGLGVLGVAKDDGVSFATLVHTGQLIMTLIAGFIAFMALARIRALQSKGEAQSSAPDESPI